MRSVIITAAAAALISLPLAAQPASASGAVVMTCSTFLNAGQGNGTASCTATGIVNGTVVVGGGVSLSYNATQTCPTSTMDGTSSGALNIVFHILRTGATGIVTTAGDINGAGTVVFSSQCPALVEIAVFTITGT